MPFDIGTLGQGLAGQTGGAILGIGLGAYNDNRQEIQNRKLMHQQQGMAKEMVDYNMSKQLQMWKDTSYSAQMEQMKKAGVNPALLYGMSGGGGITTGNPGGQGPQGARAEQNPGEIQAMAGMGIQAQQSAAQIELMKAQARNLDADTANKPTTGKNIQASTGKLIADTGNVEMDTKLKDVQKQLAEVTLQIQKGTIEDQIRILNGTANKIGEEVENLGYKNNVDKATVTTKIDQAKQDLFNSWLQGELMKAQKAKTGQETTLLTQENKVFMEKFAAELSRISHQNYADIQNSGANTQNAATQATKQAYEQFLHDIPDADKIPLDIIEKVMQAIFLRQLLNPVQQRNPIGYK